MVRAVALRARGPCGPAVAACAPAPPVVAHVRPGLTAIVAHTCLCCLQAPGPRRRRLGSRGTRSRCPKHHCLTAEATPSASSSPTHGSFRAPPLKCKRPLLPTSVNRAPPGPPRCTCSPCLHVLTARQATWCARGAPHRGRLAAWKGVLASTTRRHRLTRPVCEPCCIVLRTAIRASSPCSTAKAAQPRRSGSRRTSLPTRRKHLPASPRPGRRLARASAVSVPRTTLFPAAHHCYPDWVWARPCFCNRSIRGTLVH